MTTDTLEIQAGPAVEVRFAPESATVEGWLARFGETDAHGEVFVPGSFSESLAEIAASGHRVPLLWAHDQTRPIGSWTSLKETPEGLYGQAEINTGTAAGREALSLVQRGDLSGASVGFLTPQGGRVGNTIRRARLMEGSLVSIPSASRARIKLKDFGSLGALADALVSGTPMARKDAEFIARRAWPAVSGPDPEQLNQLAGRLDAATARLKGF